MVQNNELLALDEVISRVVASDTAEEMKRIQAETVFCAPCLQLYEGAAKGWSETWQREEHPGSCHYCKSAARVGLHRGYLWGLWLFEDQSNPELPKWWRDAIAIYLSTDAPHWLRLAHEFWTHMNSEAVLIPVAAMHAEGDSHREKTLGNWYDEKSGLDTTLILDGEGTLVVQVDDADVTRPGRKVIAGVATRTGIVRKHVTLQLSCGQLIGRTAITMDDLRNIGVGYEIMLVPAVELESVAA